MSSHEDVPGYFKSSFARSLAFSSESKSLEPVVLIPVESSPRDRETSPPTEKPQVIVKPSPRRSVPSIPTYDSIRDSFRRPRNDAIKFWKMKQDHVGSETNGWSTPMGNSTHSSEEEILRLRKECQGLMETNRKLLQGGSNMDVTLLQSQVDTLHWQLKQAESNRQMYRAVMEQVSKFLERVHKALETNTKQGPRAKHRSRSVHTVANGSGVHSRASSPSPSASSCSTVHRANSISQIQDSYSTWRSSRMTVVEETIPPEKLSQEAFRLLRTVQSLLNTREPDLARLSDHEHSSNDNRDSTSMGSCSSLVLNGGGGREESKASGPATPQLSVGSAEDESGFSSMSSFHEHHQEDHQGRSVRSEDHHGRSARSEDHQVRSARSEDHQGRSARSEDHQGRSARSASFQNGEDSVRTLRSGSFQHEENGVKRTLLETVRVSEPPRPPNIELPNGHTRSSIDLSQGRPHHSEPMKENRSSSFQASAETSFPPLSNPRSFHELGLPLVDPSYRHRRWSSTPVDNPPDSLRVLWV